MVVRKQQVVTTLNSNEKKALDDFALEWGLKSGTVLRRLVLFFNQGKISIIDLIQKTEQTDNDNLQEKTHVVRIALSDVEKQNFLSAIKDWDFPVSAILRRLVRALLSGNIPKSDLW